MKTSGTALSYEGIREEILKEHVLSTYRKHLIVFLAEREFSTLDEISVMAERYESVHARPTTWSGRDRLGGSEIRRPLRWQPRNEMVRMVEGQGPEISAIYISVGRERLRG